MRRFAPVVFVLITTVVLSLLSCSSSPQKKIIGRWVGQGEERSTSLQFFPDGTVVWYEFGNVKQTGKYSFPDTTHLLIVEGRNNALFEITLSTDHLKLMRHQRMFRDVELVKQ
jgi:hypothetical protein